MHSVLSELRYWGDGPDETDPGEFLRSVVLPKIMPAKVAADAEPAEPEILVLETPDWLSGPKPEAMTEASRTARFFEGVPYAVGERKLAAYREAKEFGHGE